MARAFKPPPRPTGVPKKFIDWAEVDKDLIAGCTGVEIAASFGISPDTLYMRCQEEKSLTFSAYSQEKRSAGDKILRRAQFINAVNGKNTTMQIWLGKNRLGQKDCISEERLLKTIQETLTATHVVPSPQIEAANDDANAITEAVGQHPGQESPL